MSVFSQTQNLVAFMNNNGFTTVDLRVNQEKGTKFVAFDGNKLSARVGKDLDAITADLSISYFEPEDGGEASWMIHRTGESQAVVVSTFSLEADLAKV